MGVCKFICVKEIDQHAEHHCMRLTANNVSDGFMCKEIKLVGVYTTDYLKWQRSTDHICS